MQDELERDARMAGEAENRRMRAALQAIRDTEGKVCAEYDLCTHLACQSSYRAWAIADAALAAEGVKDE